MSEPTLQGALLVIIDDDEANILTLQTALELVCGATVQAFRDARKALWLLQEVQPVLILSDVSMPHLNGPQLLLELRRLPHLDNVPIVALTAHAMPGDREQFLAAGFDSYISKPFEVEALNGLLLDIIQAKTHQQ